MNMEYFMKDLKSIQEWSMAFMMKKPMQMESMKASASNKASAQPLMNELVDLY